MNVASSRRHALGSAPRIQRQCHLAAPRAHAAVAPASTLAGVSDAEIQSSRAHCSNLLKRFDAPSYTLTPFIPRAARDAHLALRSLNVEVARVADQTSHAAVAQLRMQFWRDAIGSALAGAPRKEPTAILLAAAAASLSAATRGQRTFSRAWLGRLVTAREQRLGNPPWPSLAALETYAEHTYATLLYLTLAALPLASTTADHLASHVGKAQGIAAVLRGLPLVAFPGAAGAGHASTHNAATAALGGAVGPRLQGSVALPLDVMADAGVRDEDVLQRGGAAPGLRDAVFAVATRANDHLITAREMLRNVQAGRDVGHEFEHQHDPEHAAVREEAEQSGAGQMGDAKQREAGQRSDARLAAQAAQVHAGFGVLMPAVATQMWLDKLQKVDFDVFDPSLRMSAGDWRLPLKAYWAFTQKRL